MKVYYYKLSALIIIIVGDSAISPRNIGPVSPDGLDVGWPYQVSIGLSGRHYRLSASEHNCFG